VGRAANYETYRTVLIFALLAAPLGFAAEPFIPAPLNEVLGRLTHGMTGAEALKEFLKAYPKTKLLLGPWSGTDGALDLRLNERYSVLISAAGGAGDLTESTACLSSKMNVSTIDLQRRHRLDIEDLDIDNPGAPTHKPKSP
jgi:hypothetical protein